MSREKEFAVVDRKQRRMPHNRERRARFDVELESKRIIVRLERKDFDLLVSYGGVAVMNYDGTVVDVAVKDVDYE